MIRKGIFWSAYLAYVAAGCSFGLPSWNQDKIKHTCVKSQTISNKNHIRGSQMLRSVYNAIQFHRKSNYQWLFKPLFKSGRNQMKYWSAFRIGYPKFIWIATCKTYPQILPRIRHYKCIEQPSSFHSVPFPKRPNSTSAVTGIIPPPTFTRGQRKWSLC